MASARGKVILVGEHAVVYGRPAIAAGIERGAWASARWAPESELRVTGPEGTNGHLGHTNAPQPVEQAFTALQNELQVTGVAVEARLQLPAGCGLGASAALAVAIARAILELSGDRPELDRVLGAAHAWEQVFHGNPSGIDAAVAALGGCLRFVRGHPPQPVRVAQDLVLAVAVAGPPASTRAMVAAVARQREAHPEQVDALLDEIGCLAEEAQACLGQGALDRLGNILDSNQALLERLGVSTPAIARACAEARKAGALGAKLTGSGGGGAVIALVRDEGESVLEAWRSQGLECFAARVSTRNRSPL